MQNRQPMFTQIQHIHCSYIPPGQSNQFSSMHHMCTYQEKTCHQIRWCCFQPEASVWCVRSLMAVLQTYHFKGFFVPIGVDRWQQVDPGLLHQVTYPLVAGQILQTHELHQQEEQLSSQHLVTMGTRCVTKLWFTWSTGLYEGRDGRLNIQSLQLHDTEENTLGNTVWHLSCHYYWTLNHILLP